MSILALSRLGKLQQQQTIFPWDYVLIFWIFITNRFISRTHIKLNMKTEDYIVWLVGNGYMPPRPHLKRSILAHISRLFNVCWQQCVPLFLSCMSLVNICFKWKGQVKETDSWCWFINIDNVWFLLCDINVKWYDFSITSDTVCGNFDELRKFYSWGTVLFSYSRLKVEILWQIYSYCATC